MENQLSQTSYEQLNLEVLSFDRIPNFPVFNALSLIHHLNIVEPLTEDFYTKYTVKKQNGKLRILHEPKPVLKEVQSQLLKFIYTNENREVRYRNNPRRVNKFILRDCAVAYRPGISVVRNANFHVANDVVMKLDIKDFFGSVKTEKLIPFWMNLLSTQSHYLYRLGILAKGINEEDQLVELMKLSKKLVNVISLNGFLPQGSPTSGILANHYLVRFDKFFLDYCIRNGLNYSRYSDDITVSGSKDKLNPPSVLGTINRLIKLEQLQLNRTKTRVLRKNQRQIVTGVVVNEKKSVPKTLKRNLRQQMYFLKKFGEDHIARLKTTTPKYLQKIKGEISWVLSVEKSNAEFHRYFGELCIILRFFESNKKISEAIDYIRSVEALALKLNTQESNIFGDLEWKKEDETYDQQSGAVSDGIIQLNKRGKNISLLTEARMIEIVSKLNDGWRLPSTDEFKMYLQETCYDDRQRLGLRIPMDPQFNGFFNKTSNARAFNKIAAYWTSSISHLPDMAQSNCRLGRNVFVCLPRKVGFKASLNHRFKKFTKTTGHIPVNEFLSLGGTVLDIDRDYFSRWFNLHRIKQSYSSAFSLRLVRSINIDSKLKSIDLPIHFWNSVSNSKYSSDLGNLGIDSVPYNVLKNWKSSSILLSNNKLKSIDQEHLAPVNRIDLSNNDLEYFDMNSIPQSVKHLILHENTKLVGMEVPIKKLIPRLHEFTLDTPELPTLDFCEIYENTLELKFHQLHSDEEIDHLIHQQITVAALQVTVQIGANKIDSTRLFERLNQIKGLETLSILFEPYHKDLKDRLAILKDAEVFHLTSLLELNEFVGLDQSQGELFVQPIDPEMLAKNHIFYPSHLQSKRIHSLIIDFSWLPNLVFRGNFNVKPEKYHLLHPGIPVTDLPATSESYHRPNILLKIIGVQESFPSNYFSNCQFQHLKIYYPLNQLIFEQETNLLFDILPTKQFHVENFVVVCTNSEKRSIRRGAILSLFPGSRAFQSVSRAYEKNNKKSIGFGKSKTFFNFPLVGYSLKYDVFKISVPFRSMFRIVSAYKNNIVRDRETGRLKKISEGRTEFSVFQSSTKFDLKQTDQLNRMSIFPMLQNPPSEPLQILPSILRKKYVIKRKQHAIDPAAESLSREELLAELRSGNIDPMKLSRRQRKDDEIMLAAIHGNSFSFILAHPSLKLNSTFVLAALERSLRILVFLNQVIQDEKKRKNAVLPAVANYLTEKYKAQDLYYLLNQIFRRIAYGTKGVHRFIHELEEHSNLSELESIEQEITSFFNGNRAGMRRKYYDYFVQHAIEKKYFNANGFYLNLNLSVEDALDCVCLDLSYTKKFQPLILPSMPNLKTLKLSFSRFSDVSDLPLFGSCEELYFDGLNASVLGDIHVFSSKFPKLKKLYARCSPFLMPEHLKSIIENCQDLNFIDVSHFYDFYSMGKELREMCKKLDRTIDIREDIQN